MGEPVRKLPPGYLHDKTKREIRYQRQIDFKRKFFVQPNKEVHFTTHVDLDDEKPMGHKKERRRAKDTIEVSLDELMKLFQENSVCRSQPKSKTEFIMLISALVGVGLTVLTSLGIFYNTVSMNRELGGIQISLKHITEDIKRIEGKVDGSKSK